MKTFLAIVAIAAVSAAVIVTHESDRCGGVCLSSKVLK